MSSRLTKSSSSAVLTVRGGGGPDEKNVNFVDVADGGLRRTSSLKPNRSTNFKDFKAFEVLLNKFRRKHSPDKDCEDEEPLLPTVTEENPPKKRLQIGEGVKALLASSRSGHNHTRDGATVSSFKKLRRSLSARLLGGDHSAKQQERRYRSFIVKERGGDKCAGSPMTSSPTISSDHLLHERLDSPDFPPESPPGSVSSHSSSEKKNDDVNTPSRASVKKKKYFSEKQNNKNIFKKLLHPSYHERSAQFHRLFDDKVGPDPDEFLASYSCAYQREILCQGRMYISQRHICFYANIFGWETNLVVPVSEITAITKERAAKIFPNSIQIEMKDESRHFFASFVNREKSLTVLLKVLEKVQKGELMSPEELWEYMNPEDEDKVRRRGRLAKTKSEQSRSRNSSDLNTPDMTPPPTNRPVGEIPSIAEASSQSSLEQEDVNCPCDSHNGKLLLDNVYSLSVDEIYELLFTDSPWFKKFNDSLKNTVHSKVSENVSGYVASPWATDKDGIRSRTCTYTMALNHAMAPKSCVVTEKQVITHFGRNGDGFVVNKETQNAGVPYANDFVVQCIYCVSKISDHEARIKVHGGIVYKRTIWSVVRGYIEKSTYQGLDDHYTALENTLRDECDRRAMRLETREPVIDRSDEESVSSVEDPITEAPRIRSPIRGRIARKELPAPKVTSAPPVITSAPDYGFYIRIIICLLTGLLLLNTLLLFQLNNIESQPLNEDIAQLLRRVADQSKSNEYTEALANLLEKVNQLASELQKLKYQISEKQEL